MMFLIWDEGRYSFPQEHPKASEFQAMSVVCEGLEMEPPQIAMHLYRAMNDSSLHMPEDTSGLAFERGIMHHDAH